MARLRTLTSVSALAFALCAAQLAAAQTGQISQTLPLSDSCELANIFGPCDTPVLGTQTLTTVNPVVLNNGHIQGDFHVSFDGQLQIQGVGLRGPSPSASAFVTSEIFDGTRVDLATEYDLHLDVPLGIPPSVAHPGLAFDVTSADVRAINIDIVDSAYDDGDEGGTFSLAAIDPTAVVDNAVQLEGRFQSIGGAGPIQFGTLEGTATLLTGTSTTTFGSEAFPYSYVSPFALDVQVAQTVTTQLDETGLITPTISVTDGINMNGSRITNLGAGIDAGDAVNVGQLQAAIAHIDFSGATPDSVQIGNGSTAGGGKAVAIGFDNQATGDGAVAIGDPNVAIGTGAVAIGANNMATGTGAVAIGNLSVAAGDSAT